MKQNKKGFTIIELVIVISVVAILAGVLIPVFSNIVKKANLSADQVAVRNMNTAIATTSILDGDIEKVTIIRETLDQAGYRSDDLSPITKGHKFYWNKTYNVIMLVDCTNEDSTKWSVVYPTDTPAKAEFENPSIRNTTNYDLSSLPLAEMEELTGEEKVVKDTVASIGNVPDTLTLDTALKFTATETAEEAE